MQRHIGLQAHCWQQVSESPRGLVRQHWSQCARQSGSERLGQTGRALAEQHTGSALLDAAVACRRDLVKAESQELARIGSKERHSMLTEAADTATRLELLVAQQVLVVWIL